jgi:hypothetical protein
MANTTNFNWETPDDTDLVKDGAAAIRTLGSSIDTSMSELKGGTTGQLLSKTSNTDMDFTWVSDLSSLKLVGSTTFTSASSASLDNLFSSTYENYKVVIAVSGSQVVLNYRLRASAADNTTAAYSNQYLVADNTTVVASRATGLTSGSIGQMVTGGYSGFETTFYRPFVADATISRTVSACNVAGGYISDYQSNFSTGTSFTGLSIIPTSGTITGTMRVYGLRNS